MEDDAGNYTCLIAGGDGQVVQSSLIRGKWGLPVEDALNGVERAQSALFFIVVEAAV